MDDATLEIEEIVNSNAYYGVKELCEAILKWHNKKVLMLKKSYYSRGFNDCSNGQLYEPIKESL